MAATSFCSLRVRLEHLRRDAIPLRLPTLSVRRGPHHRMMKSKDGTLAAKENSQNTLSHTYTFWS
jgi:hypothetical protein